MRSMETPPMSHARHEEARKVNRSDTCSFLAPELLEFTSPGRCVLATSFC